METLVCVWNVVLKFIIPVTVPCIALGAALIARDQLRAMRASQSGQLLVNLWDKFDGPEMRGIRQRAAKSLLEPPKPDDPLGDEDVDRLLNWFEMLGILVHNDAVLLAQAEEHFRYWIWGYWQASREQIEQYRKNNSEPRYYNHLQWLAAAMANHNKRALLGENPNVAALPVKETVTRLLEDESNIKLGRK